MKKFTFFLLTALLYYSATVAQQGFSSVTTLDNIVSGVDTKDKPQAKSWFYAGKWWCVVPAASNGTQLFRLDGTTWKPMLKLLSSGSRADCWVVGDVVHILLYKGASANSFISSVQYDAATGTYKFWSKRAANVTLSMPAGSETSTLTVDGQGRMWVATAGVTNVQVWYSDSPYSSWSAPITIATGIKDDDICAITKLPGKIGVLWSNQNTGLFGFKTHTDGSSPTDWSSDEMPASQSAISGLPRMADDHMNMVVASDGTLYCAAKTSYNTPGYPQLILLVRRPSGSWDNLYPVTIDDGSREGTQAIILLNEVLGKVKVVFTTLTNGGFIAYRESSISNISFGETKILISSGGMVYNHANSTHNPYNPDVVILATKMDTSPYQVVSVLASDAASSDHTPPAVVSINRQSPASDTTSLGQVTFRTTFSENVTGVDTADFAIHGTASGAIAAVSGSGSTYDVTVNNITGSGTLGLDLKSSGTGITDAAGNAISGGFTSGQTYNIIQHIPTLSSVSIASNNSTASLAKAGDIVTLHFTASEPVNTPAVTIFTHSVVSTPGSNNSFTATYSLTNNDATGIIPFTIDFTSTKGAAGTRVTATTDGTSVTFDKTAPGVTSINRHLPATQNTTANQVTFQITFSESVTGVDAADFAIRGTASGTIASFSGSGTTYDITVNAITGTGTLGLDLKSSGTGIMDAAGNIIPGGFTSGESYTIEQADVTAPSVQSIDRFSPTTQSTSTTSVVFRVTFSENVSGVDVNDFSLTATGTVQGTINSVNGSGGTYDVTLGSLSGSGDIRLDLKGSGTGIVDAAGNAISGGYTAGQIYSISIITDPNPVGESFVSVTPLGNIVSGVDTRENPQAKSWFYAGKWWCVVPAGSNGTQIFRLDGTTWTPVLKLLSSGSRADCWVVGDVVHFLLYKGASANAYISSAQYDAATGTYKFWSKRAANVTLSMPAGSETATLTVDGQGRMWVASAGVADVQVWYSDAPYTSWSAPITIASGINDDDICAITKLPGKIGVFWSNQNTKRFGFKTHTDGSSPTEWSSDEVPASQSAIDNVGSGMADDFMNLVVASDGTMYAAVKTNFGRTGYVSLGLLVRRPSGSWDNMYPVLVEDGSKKGTEPIVLLNETLGKIKVIFNNGSNIAYRQSATSNIAFGATQPLISGSLVYRYPTSTHNPYNPDVVILATKMDTSPYQVVSVLASDATAATTVSTTSVSNTTKKKAAVNGNGKQLQEMEVAKSIKVYPNYVQKGVSVTIRATDNEFTEAVVSDSYGRVVHTGRFAGSMSIDTYQLTPGLYHIILKRKNGSTITQKFMVVN